MPRHRSPAQRAPQSTPEATLLCRRFVEIATELAIKDARRSLAHARIDAHADIARVPLQAEANELLKQLKPWWAAHVDELTAGRRKSIELGGCQIGYRLTPPKVAFEHGKDDDAAVTLLQFGYDELVRVKAAPDKPAILKALDQDPDADRVPIELLGFAAEQKEEFFVDAIGPTPTAFDAGDDAEA